MSEKYTSQSDLGRLIERAKKEGVSGFTDRDLFKLVNSKHEESAPRDFEDDRIFAKINAAYERNRRDGRLDPSIPVKSAASTLPSLKRTGEHLVSYQAAGRRLGQLGSAERERKAAETKAAIRKLGREKLAWLFSAGLIENMRSTVPIEGERFSLSNAVTKLVAPSFPNLSEATVHERLKGIYGETLRDLKAGE